MNTKYKLPAAVLAAGALLVFLPPVQDDTLTFTNVPAGSAAAAMSKRFGATIVFRGSVNKSLPVTFSVDDPDTAGGRLAAVSALAGALDLDFQKVYVVSKIDPGTSVPPIMLDSNAPIIFRSTHMPVREAIQTVAAVDNAVTQISSAIDGTVVFSDPHVGAADAAASIAKQTGTQWKAYYGLFKRGEAPARLSGTVLDQTADGQPITVLPLLSFRATHSVTVPLHSGADAVVGPFARSSGRPDVVSVPNTSTGTLDPFGFGDPYGYGSGYGPYGYAGPNGSFATPGSVFTPGVGVSPAIPGVNAPPVNAAAGPNGTAILPGFPYMGNIGGQTMVGGY